MYHQPPVAHARCAPYALRGLEGLCPRNAGEGQDGGAQKLKIAATRVSSFPFAEDGRGDRSSFPPRLDDPKVLALFDRYAPGIKAVSFLDRHLV